MASSTNGPPVVNDNRYSASDTEPRYLLDDQTTRSPPSAIAPTSDRLRWRSIGVLPDFTVKLTHARFTRLQVRQLSAIFRSSSRVIVSGWLGNCSSKSGSSLMFITKPVVEWSKGSWAQPPVGSPAVGS